MVSIALISLDSSSVNTNSSRGNSAHAQQDLVNESSRNVPPMSKMPVKGFQNISQVLPDGSYIIGYRLNISV